MHFNIHAIASSLLFINFATTVNTLQTISTPPAFINPPIQRMVTSSNQQQQQQQRQKIPSSSTLLFSSGNPRPTAADSSSPTTDNNNDPSPNVNGIKKPKVAYRSYSVPMDEYGINVPMAMWYPTNNNIDDDDNAKRPIMDYPAAAMAADTTSSFSYSPVRYNHRISVAKIGRILANWNLPSFFDRDYSLYPTLTGQDDPIVVDGTSIPLPEKGPVVLLAHGYLGSRFDLSHYAEDLAQNGFICISPEYPESLAASYPSSPSLNRQSITQNLLTYLSSTLLIKPTTRGIIGHSLGCGTAVSTGDKSWTRVCIAGYPREDEGIKGGNMFFVASLNDGLVGSRERLESIIPRDMTRLTEESLLSSSFEISRRTALIFEQPTTAPNHISFLASGANDAMVELLSPLLPVARALGIPVLDFDKYVVSRDSERVGEVLIPVVTDYMKRFMMEELP